MEFMQYGTCVCKYNGSVRRGLLRPVQEVIIGLFMLPLPPPPPCTGTTTAVVKVVTYLLWENIPNTIICVGASFFYPFCFYSLSAPGPTYQLDSETAKLPKIVIA